MCGRFTLRRPGKTKFDVANEASLPLLAPRYNIAPSQPVLAIIKRGVVSHIDLVQWGLIPSWSKEAKGFINARAETLEEKASFSESFQRRRCLIPADGFYEWRRVGRSKQPFYFQMNDESTFMFAGLWDEWRQGGNLITSCAIVTTTANELLAPVHDRMPVILKPESYDVWLSSESKPAALHTLLSPFPSSKMKSHPVSSAVNRPENDNEHLADHVETEIGTTPTLF